jgi:hypothetical protein
LDAKIPRHLSRVSRAKDARYSEARSAPNVLGRLLGSPTGLSAQSALDEDLLVYELANTGDLSLARRAAERLSEYPDGGGGLLARALLYAPNAQRRFDLMDAFLQGAGGSAREAVVAWGRRWLSLYGNTRGGYQALAEILRRREGIAASVPPVDPLVDALFDGDPPQELLLIWNQPVTP